MTLFLSSEEVVQQQQQQQQDFPSYHDAMEQWKHQEGGILVLQSLKYLDVVTLIKKKLVGKKLKLLCTKAINNKCVGGGMMKKKFETNEELQQAVGKYSPPTYNIFHLYEDNRQCSPIDAEEIASTYGYPINTWDVSNVTDFSDIFHNKHQFNEPIGSWDTSNATTMASMFCDAHTFNQDISSWDVSNVKNMRGLFWRAGEFNQPVGSWDVSNVTDMDFLFNYAECFSQDLSSWDVSNVTDFFRMFYNCSESFHAEGLAWFRDGMRA